MCTYCGCGDKDEFDAQDLMDEGDAANWGYLENVDRDEDNNPTQTQDEYYDE